MAVMAAAAMMSVRIFIFLSPERIESGLVIEIFSSAEVGTHSARGVPALP